SFIKKTDQERCQNLVAEIFGNEGAKRHIYEVTTKLDGASVTFYHMDGEIGACTRNLELKLNDENASNAIVRVLFDSTLNVVLPRLGNVAIQGEIMGPGIQGNREKLSRPKFFVFDIQNLDSGEYFTSKERLLIMDRLIELGVDTAIIDHVPVFSTASTLDDLCVSYINSLLALADGPSLVNAVREGLVFKRNDGRFSFKAISNAFLVKEG